MAGFVAGQDRGQATLLPECLEDWVDENNSVRAVDVFVEALDLRDLGFEGVDAAGIGRPSYRPGVLLKLYIYGYLNRVQSSRRLESEAGRNLEVMWLTGRLAPDHKTIADFRKDNGRAIRKVCARFVELCRKMGLLARASVAIDGSKFKAVNSRDNNFTQGKIQRRQKQIEESVARYMSQLDTADRQTAAGEEPSETVLLTKTRLKEKLAKLEEEVKRLAGIEKALLASPDKQISLTDPDCRSMATSGRGSGMVAYNVQSAVDTTNHLIVAHEVTNVGTDRSQLATMAQAAKAALRSDNLDVVADRGYFKGEEILACEQAGVAVTLPKPQTSGAKSAGRFGKPDFVYLAKDDAYRCPAGEELAHHFTADEDGQKNADLLDEGVPDMPAQGSVHDGQRAPHQTLGTRTRCRGRANAARSEPASHACAPRNRRASLRHAEDADGGDALSDEAVAQCRDRDGAARARLQPHARDEHRRYQTTPGRDPGLRSCARRVTVQVARHGSRLRPD